MVICDGCIISDERSCLEIKVFITQNVGFEYHIHSCLFVFMMLRSLQHILQIMNYFLQMKVKSQLQKLYVVKIYLVLIMNLTKYHHLYKVFHLKRILPGLFLGLKKLMMHFLKLLLIHYYIRT